MSAAFVEPIHVQTVDGGYSGELTVTVAQGGDGAPLVFLESDLLASMLVLTPEQTVNLAAALTAAYAKTLRR